MRHVLKHHSPHALALIEQGQPITYGALAGRAGAVSGQLPRLATAPIALLLPNGMDYIAALWGILQSGHTAFPLSTQLTGAEIAPLLKQAGVEMVITTTAYRGRLGDIPVDVRCMDEPGPPPKAPPPPVAADPRAPMVLLATSGTTGRAKIVQLSQRNVEASVRGYLNKLSLRGQSPRYTLAVPYSSVYGIMILTACLTRGFPLVVLDEAFTLDGLYRAAQEHGITHYEGSATAIMLMEQLAGRTVPYDISTLRYFGFGGSKVSGRTIRRVLAAYPGVELYQGYGMTEAAPLIAKHPQGPLEKPDSVGTAIAGVHLAVEAHSGITQAPGVEGEILVRGPNVMLGYLDNEAETAQALKDGWLHTGDLGYVDEAGYLYISGRSKSLVIVRGFKVQPEEVEATILDSGLASDCLVYGEAHDNGSETLCAQVVPAHGGITAGHIRNYWAQHLAEYKIPQSITLCARLPKGATGKTQRGERPEQGGVSRWS